MSWTDERVELLRKLWQEGYSASQVAGELGGGVTRNAVIGKVHRLGLATREKTQSPIQKKSRQKAATPRTYGARPTTMVRGNTVLKIAGSVPELQVMPITEAVVIPLSDAITLMDLRETMCRWPLGDPTAAEFRFCGNKTGEVGPYCAGHARLAYQPAFERRLQRKMMRTG